MIQSRSEDMTWMLEVQTDIIIQLSNKLEAANQRIAHLEQRLAAYAAMINEINETNADKKATNRTT